MGDAFVRGAVAWRDVRLTETSLPAAATVVRLSDTGRPAAGTGQSGAQLHRGRLREGAVRR